MQLEFQLKIRKFGSSVDAKISNIALYSEVCVSVGEGVFELWRRGLGKLLAALEAAKARARGSNSTRQFSLGWQFAKKPKVTYHLAVQVNTGRVGQILATVATAESIKIDAWVKKMVDDFIDALLTDYTAPHGSFVEVRQEGDELPVHGGKLNTYIMS